MRNKFSDIANVDIEIRNNVVVLYPKGKIAKNKEAPFGLMCASFMIRHAISFATMHHVPSVVIKDLEEKFICYVLYVGEQFSSKESENYLAKVGFGEVSVDTRETYRNAAGAYSKQVRDWSYRVVPNRVIRRRKKKK